MMGCCNTMEDRLESIKFEVMLLNQQLQCTSPFRERWQLVRRRLELYHERDQILHIKGIK